MSNPLGRALADTGRERLLRSASIAVATFVLALSLNVPLAARAMYEGILERGAARDATYLIDPESTDELGNPIAPETPPVATIWVQDDRAGWDLTTVVTLAVIDPTAPPPPGLDRWPEPGEVFASQALVEDPEGPALIATYGYLAGTIVADTLPLPTDRVAWVGADPARMGPTAYGIPSFGRPPRSVDDGGSGYFSWFNGATTYMSPLKAWTVVAGIFLVAPSIVYLLVSLRLGAERRAQRVAVLRTLGAYPRQVRGAIVAELAPPVALGAAAALAVSLVATATTWTLPFLDAPIIGADLRANASSFLLGPVIAALVAALVVLWNDRARRTSASSNRPAAPVAKERMWPVFVLTASVLVANYGYAHFDARERPDLGVLVVLACGAVGALSASFLTSMIVRRLGRVLVTLGRRRPRASALLVAGRELMVLARPVVRATATFSVASLVVVHVWVLVTISSTEEQNARAAHEANAGITATLRVSNSEVNLPRVAEHLPEDVVLLQVSERGAVVHGTCADLETVFGTCAPDAPLQPRLQQVASHVSRDARAIILDAPGTFYQEEPFSTVLVSTTGAPLALDDLDTPLRAEVSPVVELDEPGAGELMIATFMLHQGRWYVAAAVVGLLLVALTAAATMTFEIARASRRFAALGVLEGRSRFYALLGAGSVGIPLLVAALAGLGTGLAQIGTLVALDDRLTFPWSMTIGITVGSIAAAVGGSTVTARYTQRAAARWRASVEE